MTESTRFCSIEGCDRPSRKRGWCTSHYSQWHRTGEAKPFAYTWANEPNCLVCGEPNGEHRSRKFCSAGCQQAYTRTGGDRPESFVCGFCQKLFSLRRRTASGRLQRIDTVWCPDCGRDSPDVQRFKRYGITREQYEAATAQGCRICQRKDRKLHVDHDHACCPMRGGNGRTCGQCIRGLICGPCNRGLGLFGDDSEALVRAAEYLRNPSWLP